MPLTTTIVLMALSTVSTISGRVNAKLKGLPCAGRKVPSPHAAPPRGPCLHGLGDHLAHQGYARGGIPRGARRGRGVELPPVGRRTPVLQPQGPRGRALRGHVPQPIPGPHLPRSRRHARACARGHLRVRAAWRLPARLRPPAGRGRGRPARHAGGAQAPPRGGGAVRRGPQAPPAPPAVAGGRGHLAHRRRGPRHPARAETKSRGCRRRGPAHAGAG